MPAMAPRLSAGEVGKAAAQRAKQASHEICDTPTAGQSGIVASRAGMFRSWGLLKSTSQKDLRHSRSDGVRAALQMSAETPRSLTPGRVPTTLQAYIEERPPTPRREEIVTVAMPMDTASYPPLSPRLRGDFPATERSVSRRSRTLLSREESELTLRSNSVTKPRPWSDLDTKPSMARRADGAAFRVRPLTPREGYDMLAAGLPSPVHRAEEDCCRTPREPNMTPSSSVSTACPEPRRRWSDLLADAEVLGAALRRERGERQRHSTEVQASRRRRAAGAPSSPSRQQSPVLKRGEGWTLLRADGKAQSALQQALTSFHLPPEPKLTRTPRSWAS